MATARWSPPPSQLRILRPDLRLRTRGDRAGRIAPHVGGGGERFLLHHLHERKLRAAGDAVGRREGISRPLPAADRRPGHGARELLGSGTILREVLAAAEVLQKEYGVPADVMGVTSFSELRRDAMAVERWEPVPPGQRAAERRTSRVPQRAAGALRRRDRLHEEVEPDQIRRWVPGALCRARYRRLWSQRRDAALRGHFEVDRRYVAVAGAQGARRRRRASIRGRRAGDGGIGIDPERPDPAAKRSGAWS